MTTPTAFFPVHVALTEPAARGIQRFELRHLQGESLPPFTAGSHIAVRTPSGATRQYSLVNDPQESDRYVIAVKREGNGRGGSLSLVDGVRAGAKIDIAPPENLFALDERAKSFVLIAGGIGITPMMAMVAQLQREAEDGGGRKFKLVYLTRDAESTAFLAELSAPELKGKVTVHHDNGDLSNAFDLWPLLGKPGSVSGQHVYCCGPKPLMDAVRDMTGHWPAAAVHFETFAGDTAPHDGDAEFEVFLDRSGLTLTVPVGQSILQVAREAGVMVSSSCESGTCGSCKTRLLKGEADHRDLVLMPDEQADHIMVCVSRAKSGRLVVDL
jgi:phthalate 4,5-dioxygenase reductase subunit